MQNELSNQLKQRGGRRPGAGRKVKRIKALVKRCNKSTAAMILAAVDEQSKWLQFIESDDERVALDAMKFLTQMRDGRPKQQINVDDERAREVDEIKAMSNDKLQVEGQKQLAAFIASRKKLDGSGDVS